MLRLTEDLSTGERVLTLAAGATSDGNGDVFGKVKRVGPFATGTAYSFGSPFTSLKFEAGALPDEVLVELTTARPNVAGAAGRTYTIEPKAESFSATLRLHYQDDELGNAQEADLQLWRFDSAQQQWVLQGRSAADTASNWVELTGVASWGRWAVATGRNAQVFLPVLVREAGAGW